MRIRRLTEAPIQERNRLRSHILMDAGELGSRNLCVTWAVAEPGSEQRSHLHAGCEQVYVIIKGSGVMYVSGDERRVEEGDLVFIPPGSEHGLLNDGTDELVFVSAAAPPFSMDEFFRTQLAPEVDEYLDDEG